MFATAIDIGDNMMDESKIRQVEMDLFQDRTEQAVPSALEMISEMKLKHRYVAESAEQNSRFTCMRKLILWKTLFLTVVNVEKEMC